MTWTISYGETKPTDQQSNEGNGERQNRSPNVTGIFIVILAVALLAMATVLVTFLLVRSCDSADPKTTVVPSGSTTPGWTTRKDNSFEGIRRRKRLAAHQWLVSQRKQDWGWGERVNAEAMIALQLNGEGRWCCQSLDSQLSRQRLQLELLEAISWNGTLEQREWFGGKLGQYITGLVATCQNPRDFYGRDLTIILRHHLHTFSRYWFNLFAYNWALIGLHNAGEPIDDKFINILLQKQKNGSFGGVDSTAMSIMTLSCVPQKPGVNSTLTAAVRYLLSLRKQDGSFGNEMSTGLALQALKASGARVSEEQRRASLTALMNAVRPDGSMEMVGLSFQVLPALAERAYTDVANLVKCPK